MSPETRELVSLVVTLIVTNLIAVLIAYLKAKGQKDAAAALGAVIRGVEKGQEAVDRGEDPKKAYKTAIKEIATAEEIEHFLKQQVVKETARFDPTKIAADVEVKAKALIPCRNCGHELLPAEVEIGICVDCRSA